MYSETIPNTSSMEDAQRAPNSHAGQGQFLGWGHQPENFNLFSISALSPISAEITPSPLLRQPDTPGHFQSPLPAGVS